MMKKNCLGIGLGIICWIAVCLVIYMAGAESEDKQIGAKRSLVAKKTIAISEQPKEKEREKSKQNVYSIRERFELGDFSYEILNASATIELDVGFSREKASDGAVFYLIEFEIENLQNKTDTVITGDFKIRDKKGRKFSTSSRAMAALSMGGKQNPIILQLQPGIKKKITAAFELPISAVRVAPSLIVPKKGIFSTGSVEVRLPLVRVNKKK